MRMSDQHNKTCNAKQAFALMALILAFSASLATAQPSSLSEKIFFYNDIYHFVGKPYRSPLLADVRSIAQPFVSKCANLNRIIIPFYLDENERSGEMRFNLYQVGKQNEPVFFTNIDGAKFPAPVAIGTHQLRGILYPVWIPPLADSANNEFIWEIIINPAAAPKDMGLYLTDSQDAHIQPVLINGLKGTGNAAFFSYCQYRFDWDQIVKHTGQKLWREKYFIAAFSLLIGGILFLFPRFK